MSISERIEKEVNIPEASIKIRSDGIMHIHIKVEMFFELQHSKNILKARSELAGEKTYPIMYTANSFVIPNTAVKEYVASENRSRLVAADAFVVNSLAQRIAANFYKILFKPTRPTAYFTKESEAIEWLKKYVD